ncbi:kinase-like domain-containing protein [Melanogaster broomeanus]|nr:kinase-like domain-containing protein [Melanogaster broomeanus]
MAQTLRLVEKCCMTYYSPCSNSTALTNSQGSGMDFDFTAYLSKLLSLPPDQITIQISHALDTPTPTPSIVLKYAPPFMATDPSQPLHVIRQYVEARALVLLDPSSESPLPVSSLLTKYPNFKIPRFIHHDTEQNVLMMTDLGSSVMTLDVWLAQEPAPQAEEVVRIAKDLGQFLAEFVLATSEPTIEVLARASNSVMLDQFYSYFVKITRTVLTSQGVPDAEVLVSRLDKAFRDSGKRESCLGMVDLWTSNILIDSNTNVCLIDWEFFGLSNASCELSLLVQSLQWILFRPDSTDGLVERTRAFTSTMLQNYALRAPHPSPHFQRHALLSYGCQIVLTLDFFKVDINDDMKRKILDAGVGYLRAAGESVDMMDLSMFDADSNTLTSYENLYERGRTIMAAIVR